jgi:hypothetical protein
MSNCGNEVEDKSMECTHREAKDAADFLNMLQILVWFGSTIFAFDFGTVSAYLKFHSYWKIHC